MLKMLTRVEKYRMKCVMATKHVRKFMPYKKCIEKDGCRKISSQASMSELKPFYENSIKLVDESTI